MSRRGRVQVVLALASVLTGLASAQAAQDLDPWGRPILANGRRVRGVTPVASPANASWPPLPPAATPGLMGDPVTVRPEWLATALGNGLTGLAAVDLLGDGTTRIVGTAVRYSYPADASHWVVLKPQGIDYDVEWASPAFPGRITSFTTHNLDADPALEVLIGIGQEVVVFDGATRRVASTFATSAEEVRGLGVGNVDADPALEAVFCDDDNLYILDLASGEQEFVGIGYGGTTLAVGNVDGDPALEILVGEPGQPGYVIDGPTRGLQWTNFWGFGRLLRLGDLDGDGKLEAVAADYGTIRVFDVDLQSLTASVPAPYSSVSALRVFDVEGDGPLEIVAGTSSYGKVRVYDGQTRALKWEVTNPDYDLSDLVGGNLDSDGGREILWAVTSSSSDGPRLHRLDVQTQTLEWSSLGFQGPFHGLVHGDVDGDGAPELVLASEQRGYQSGYVLRYDAQTHRLEQALETGSSGDLWRVALANLDADPQGEVCYTLANANRPVTCVDGLTGAVQWQVTSQSYGYARALALADVDLDGQLEAVTVFSRDSSGTFVQVYDAATGTLEWESPNILSSGWATPFLRVANVDADPQPELVVAAFEGNLFVLDAVTHLTYALGDHDVTALEVVDRNGDGRAEIVLGTLGGSVKVVDVSGQTTEVLGTFGLRVDSLAVRDLNGDAASDLLLGLGTELRLYDSAGALLWRSGFLGSPVGAMDGLLVADIDQDG